MKILLAATSTDTFSGASKCIVELAKKLKEKENNVIVSVPRKGSEIEALLKENAIETIVIHEYQSWYKYCNSSDNYLKTFAKNELNVLKCAKYMHTQKFDIVHVNALTAYVVGKAAIKEKIPTIWHIREFMEEDLGISFIDQKWSLKLLNKADCFIAISHQIKEKWLSQITVPIQVIYDGIPIEKYYVREKFPHCGVNILLYGRIVKGKGQQLYIKAAQQVLNEISVPCDFFFAGKIEDPTYFKECVDLVNNSHIKYIGEISDIKSLLAKTDIVCVCSMREGFGRVTIESMLGGCLVVGAAAGATVELVNDGKNGILYEPDDVNELAQKLTDCIVNFDNYQSILKNGQQFALKTFTDEITVGKILDLYSFYKRN